MDFRIVSNLKTNFTEDINSRVIFLKPT